MKTEKIEQLISSYMDGELSEQEMFRVRFLLYINPVAKQTYNKYGDLRSCFLRMPQKQLPADFAHKTLQEIYRRRNQGEFSSPNSVFLPVPKTRGFFRGTMVQVRRNVLGRRYSRLVVTFSLSLLLVAVGVISTQFFLSSSNDTVARKIPSGSDRVPSVSTVLSEGAAGSEKNTEKSNDAGNGSKDEISENSGVSQSTERNDVRLMPLRPLASGTPVSSTDESLVVLPVRNPVSSWEVRFSVSRSCQERFFRMLHRQLNSLNLDFSKENETVFYYYEMSLPAAKLKLLKQWLEGQHDLISDIVFPPEMKDQKEDRSDGSDREMNGENDGTTADLLFISLKIKIIE